MYIFDNVHFTAFKLCYLTHYYPSSRKFCCQKGIILNISQISRVLTREFLQITMLLSTRGARFWWWQLQCMVRVSLEADDTRANRTNLFVEHKHNICDGNRYRFVNGNRCAGHGKVVSFEWSVIIFSIHCFGTDREYYQIKCFSLVHYHLCCSSVNGILWFS